MSEFIPKEHTITALIQFSKPDILLDTIIHIPQNNQDLNNEMTRLAGHINAAQYRFLKLLNALIERDAWAGDSGIKSPAHWLNYYCGIAMGAAREKVRVALCLNLLPKIDQAFQKGELSFSMVRAMTRAATRDNEDYLLGIAKHGTTAHMENLVRKYKKVEHQNLLQTEQGGLGKSQHQTRQFSAYFDDDGMLVFKGKLAPEGGAVFMKALGSLLSQINENENENGKNVSAETLYDDEYEKKDTFPQKRADALALMAENCLRSAHVDSETTSKPHRYGGDKAQIVIHVDVKPNKNTKTSSEAANRDAWLENGPILCSETVRRLACDASVVTVLEDSTGKVLNIGRKSRIIPPSIRRALTIRDQGCRFPGCCDSRYVDAHHIQRGNGSEQNLSFLKPDGGVILRAVYPQFEQTASGSSGVLEIEHQHQLSGLDIDAGTACSEWQGEEMDYGMAVDEMYKYGDLRAPG